MKAKGVIEKVALAESTKGEWNYRTLSSILCYISFSSIL